MQAVKKRAAFLIKFTPGDFSLLASLVAALLVPCARAGGARSFRVVSPARTAILSVSSAGTITWTNWATGFTCTIQSRTDFGAGSWVDYLRVPVSSAITTVQVFDTTPLTGMALVPAGSFTMGDAFSEGYDDEVPKHSVYVSAFYMDKYLVTKARWDKVKTWSMTNGYSFAGVSGKAANHPVQGSVGIAQWRGATRGHKRRG